MSQPSVIPNRKCLAPFTHIPFFCCTRRTHAWCCYPDRGGKCAASSASVHLGLSSYHCRGLFSVQPLIWVFLLTISVNTEQQRKKSYFLKQQSGNRKNSDSPQRFTKIWLIKNKTTNQPVQRVLKFRWFHVEYVSGILPQEDMLVGVIAGVWWSVYHTL